MCRPGTSIAIAGHPSPLRVVQAAIRAPIGAIGNTALQYFR